MFRFYNKRKLGIKMIRKLVEEDRNSLLEYLNAEEALNIISKANVHFFGLDSKELTLYGEFDEYNNYLSVLFLFNSGVVVFSSNNGLFNNEWVSLLEDHEIYHISGIEEVINIIKPYFKEYSSMTSYLCEATKLTSKYEKSNYQIFNVTTVEECEKLYYLLKSIDEMAHRTHSKEQFLERHMKALATGNIYYIEENGIANSTAAIIAETNNTAILSMVGTAPQQRNRGLATVLVKYIMKEYIELKQKKLFLLYDNPKAGNIYKRLGFIDIDRWTQLSKK